MANVSNLANVASSASNVTIMAASEARRAAAVYNDSAAILYLKFGATATTSSFTVEIPSQGYYEFPQPCYSGIVDGIWSAADGAARVTELI